MNYNETLNQLTQSNNGYGRLKAMIGLYNPICKGDTLSFSFKGCKDYNRCAITLNGLDLYDIELSKVIKTYDADFQALGINIIKGEKITKMESINGVYNDMLKSIFEDRTNLYLSLI